jgi:hypothetical protein
MSLLINWFAASPLLLLIIPIRTQILVLNSKYPSSIMLQQKRSVQFQSIEILEFAYTVGDNPSVSSGVPLSMEWTPQMKTILPLCVFETHRPPRSSECGPRRISSRRREQSLLRSGCSIQDMTAAAKDALRIQNERAFTKYELQTRKFLHSRRQRAIPQEPAVVTAPSSPIISIRKKPPSADRSPMLPQRRSSLLTSSITSDCPSSPVTASPKAVDNDKLPPQLPPRMLEQRWPPMIARSA